VTKSKRIVSTTTTTGKSLLSIALYTTLYRQADLHSVVRFVFATQESQLVVSCKAFANFYVVLYLGAAWPMLCYYVCLLYEVLDDPMIQSNGTLSQ
jgi:hypothetical protein